VAKQYGIVVKSAPNGVTNSTAEQAIALMLAVARKNTPVSCSIKQRSLEKKVFEGIDLEGKTIGIIGCGRIGQKVAEKARALGMNVVGYDSSLDFVREQFPDSTINYVSKDEVLRGADVVSLHTGGESARY